MSNTLILYGVTDKDELVKSLGMAVDLPSDKINKIVFISNETDDVNMKILESFFTKTCCGGPEVTITELKNGKMYQKVHNEKTNNFLYLETTDLFSEALKYAKQEKQPVVIAEVGCLFTTNTTNCLVNTFQDKNIGASYCTQVVNKRIQYQPSFSPSIKYQFPLGHIAIRPELINGDEKSMFELVINAFKKSVVSKIPGIYVFK